MEHTDEQPVFEGSSTKSETHKVETVNLESLSLVLGTQSVEQQAISAQTTFSIHTTTTVTHHGDGLASFSGEGHVPLRRSQSLQSGTSNGDDGEQYLTAEECEYYSTHSPAGPSALSPTKSSTGGFFQQTHSGSMAMHHAATTTKVEITIGPQHFELLKLLGEGAFGKVILVQNHFNKQFYAMKVICKKMLKKKNNVLYMKSERDILTKISHPFLINLHFAFQSRTKLFLVTDFLSGGELFLHLKRRGLILEHEVVFYLGEMVLAIEFLHKKNILHRDLKPENVLLRHDAHVCITDFGLAKEIGDGITTRTLCGTSEYMAPEMLTRTGYGKAVDWWALGALCYEMLVGRPPFQAKSQKELDKKILSEKVSTPSYLTANAHSLLKGMLDKDSTKRLGCAKSTMFQTGGVTALKNHPFFESLDWYALEALELVPPIDLRNTDYEPAPGLSLQNKDKISPLKGEREKEVDGFEDPEVSALLGQHSELETFVAKYFHSEFTAQPLSPSLLEDVLSAATTPARSRAISPSQSPQSARYDGESERERDGEREREDFDDFDFAKGQQRFLVTVEQLEACEAYMAAKSAKYYKRKAFAEKQRAARQREEDARKQRESDQQTLTALEKKRVTLQGERQKAEKDFRTRKAALTARERETEIALGEHSQRVAVCDELLQAAAKRVKNLKKKAKDVEGLVEQQKAGKKLDKDQTLKVAKERELKEELRDAEDEERRLVGERETALPRERERLEERLKVSSEEVRALQSEFYREREGESEGVVTRIDAALRDNEAAIAEVRLRLAPPGTAKSKPHSAPIDTTSYTTSTVSGERDKKPPSKVTVAVAESVCAGTANTVPPPPPATTAAATAIASESTATPTESVPIGPVTANASADTTISVAADPAPPAVPAPAEAKKPMAWNTIASTSTSSAGTAASSGPKTWARALGVPSAPPAVAKPAVATVPAAPATAAKPASAPVSEVKPIPKVEAKKKEDDGWAVVSKSSSTTKGKKK